MIHIHTLGFPRIGENRELKFALEKFWRGDCSIEQLETVGRELRLKHWNLQRTYGLDFITVGDFAFYDQVANHIQLFGCEPQRFNFTGQEPELLRYFALARGTTVECTSNKYNNDENTTTYNNKKDSKPALEMTKWFDTNYHYLVPELHLNTQFKLNSERLFNEVKEAQALNHPIKVVLLGPLTFLWLSKEKGLTFKRFSLLERLLPVYREILQKLNALDVQWVQMDEPILGLDLNTVWREAFIPTYSALQIQDLKILLTTYFSPLKENIELTKKLNVAGWHIDVVRAPEDLLKITTMLPTNSVLSIGIIDGRNIWRTDLEKALTTLRTVIKRYAGLIWIAPSCSLLHVPFTLVADSAVDPEVSPWLAGAIEKLIELRLLKNVLVTDKKTLIADLLANQAMLIARRINLRVNNIEVAKRIAKLPSDVDQRKNPFKIRQTKQHQRLELPIFPTTTIGSFPQTLEIRQTRAAFKGNILSAIDYRKAIEKEIAYAIKRQEELDIDVLVHGEAERNDMVEYFGEQLSGFTFTANGWVQSYGSRCVKPPILFGDVTRPHPMTISWTQYAQSLTKRPVKGMLTGPITILQWSFVRDDQPRADTALQIALAIRDEVIDLEKAGISIIQIDEPAFREGLPLRQSEWRQYLQWASRSFRISASGVQDETQIHTHMCYSEFHDILPDIVSMDADVITIETSRSDMQLLEAFGDFQYPNEIGPGVYDIHSPRIPEIDEIVHLLQKAITVIPLRNLWVNPDCGLKTRCWKETEAALGNMVTAAKKIRIIYK